jgi:hypothetical protein
MADGADRVWRLPLDRDPVVEVAVSHRWRKLRETLYGDARSRPALAHWVVEHVSGPTQRAVGSRSSCTHRPCRPLDTAGPPTPGQRSSTT